MFGAGPRGEGAELRLRMSSSDDAPMRTGTTKANALAGASNKRAGPGGPAQRGDDRQPERPARCPENSGRDPSTDPAEVQTSDMVLVTLADSGGSPIASSTG